MSEHIVFLDHDTLGPEVSMRRPGFPHTWEVHGRTAPDEVAAARAEEDESLLRSRARRRQRGAEPGDPNEERPG